MHIEKSKCNYLWQLLLWKKRKKSVKFQREVEMLIRLARMIHKKKWTGEHHFFLNFGVFNMKLYYQKYLYHFMFTACKVTVELSWALGTIRRFLPIHASINYTECLIHCTNSPPVRNSELHHIIQTMTHSRRQSPAQSWSCGKMYLWGTRWMDYYLTFGREHN